MKLLQEVASDDSKPAYPAGGWNVGRLANLGVLLTCDGFSVRFDDVNLNLLFDLAEMDVPGELRAHDGQVIEIIPDTSSGIVIRPKNSFEYPNGIVLDLETLKELGIEQYEEDDGEPEDASVVVPSGGKNLGEPLSKFDSLSNDDTVSSGDEFDTLEEGVRPAFRRVGKKIKRGFRVTSGFRKGRVLSSAKSAFKPRVSAKTHMKLSIASKRKKFMRMMKGKMTRRRATSRQLVRMNKRT